MKVFLIVSKANLKSGVKTYRLFANILKKLNVELAADGPDLVSIADLVIAEVGRESTQTGWQIAQALHLKKPVLLLYRSKKPDNLPGAGSDTYLINYRRYTNQTAETVIKNFIDSHKLGAKNIRFNLFIDQQILAYLNRTSAQSGETKSEIIRRVLVKEIEKSGHK